MRGKAEAGRTLSLALEFPVAGASLVVGTGGEPRGHQTAAREDAGLYSNFCPSSHGWGASEELSNANSGENSRGTRRAPPIGINIECRCYSFFMANQAIGWVIRSGKFWRRDELETER